MATGATRQGDVLGIPWRCLREPCGRGHLLSDVPDWVQIQSGLVAAGRHAGLHLHSAACRIDLLVAELVSLDRRVGRNRTDVQRHAKRALLVTEDRNSGGPVADGCERQRDRGLRNALPVVHRYDVSGQRRRLARVHQGRQQQNTEAKLQALDRVSAHCALLMQLTGAALIGQDSPRGNRPFKGEGGELLRDRTSVRSRPLVHGSVAVDPDELHCRPGPVADETDAERRVCIDLEQILGDGGERGLGAYSALVVQTPVTHCDGLLLVLTHVALQDLLGDSDGPRAGGYTVLRPLDLPLRVVRISVQRLRPPIRRDRRLQIAGRLQCPAEREMRAGGRRGVGYGLLEHFDRERSEASTGEEGAELQQVVEGRPGCRVCGDRSKLLSRRVGTALHRRALH